MKFPDHVAQRLETRYNLEPTPALLKELCDRIRLGDRAHFIRSSGVPNRFIWNVRVSHKLVRAVVELDQFDDVRIITVLPPSKNGDLRRDRRHLNRRDHALEIEDY